MLRFLGQPSTNKKNHFILNIYLTNNQLGVLTDVMSIFNVKIINNLSNFKATIIKTGIFVSLAAYWGVILVGTFITFN
jgi:hypothetical protein